MDSNKIKVLVFVLVLILLSGLIGWYWYLRTQGVALEQISADRGLESSVPAFSGDKGSTFGNIIEGLGFQKENTTSASNTPPRFWRVLGTPGAGLGFIFGATSTRLRFIERSTGYLFETDARTGKTERLTNTLIPKVYEASFSGDGSPLIKQLMDGRESVSSLALQASTSTFQSLVQVELGDFTHTAVHPHSRGILAFVRNGDDGALIRSAWDGSAPTRIFSSRITGWRIHWPSDKNIILSEMPASGVPGSSYRLSENGLIPLVTALPGLTVLPRPDAKALLIGSDSGGFISLGAWDEALGTTVNLPLRTVPEKCVWSPREAPVAYCATPDTIQSSQFLNDWYQGRIHTQDVWWKINTAEATVELLFSPTENEAVDVESPVINDTGEYIAFRNAYDKSVWMLRIHE